MLLRQTVPADADDMSALLRQLTALGRRKSPDDPDFVRDHYIVDPDRVSCLAAIDADGTILGFQSLKRATHGNPYGLAAGWGIIGTHVRPSAARRGVGSRLFPATLEAARAAGLQSIDATIGATNAPALAYYERMGFRTHKTGAQKISKCRIVSD